MAVKLKGNSNVDVEVDANSRAMRVTLRPKDWGSLCANALSLTSGTMSSGLSAGSEIMQFRWTDATYLCVVEQVRLWAGGIGAFSAGFCKFDLLIARSWSADGSGGTAATITGNNGNKRTSMATTLLGAFRVASTSALTAGTKTLDSQGIASCGGSTTATAGTPLIYPYADFLPSDGANVCPVILAQNEGLVIQATVPAGGTWTFGVDVHYTEVSAY